MTGTPDDIFTEKTKYPGKFAFNEQVAEVFDDMITRSVPYYYEIHRMILDLLKHQLKDGANILDIGCSTGTTLCLVGLEARRQNKKVNLYGADPSGPMLEKTRQKLLNHNLSANLSELEIQDADLSQFDMIIMNYTLQFINPKQRHRILKSIHSGLNKGGLLILSEKIKSSFAKNDELLIDIYYDYKRRNGYSDLEISRKRESLESILIPWTPETNINALKKAGFKRCETFFRWSNFASFVGFK